jgi:UDP-N-acetylmuramoyl-tripeptide--D-alanyl-D-alanine ligase
VHQILGKGMQKFSVRALAKIIKADIAQSTSLEQQAASSSFAGVSIDSRTIKAGDCFFAIRGENFDGHDYVADAFAKGAVCAVVSKDVSSCVMSSVYREQKSTRSTVRNTRYAILIADDTVKALGDFAREYRRLCGFKVVAITGSVGKTTTRHIVYHVLSRYYRVFQSPKNFNNNIGLPLTLLGADPSDEIIVAELGTNHPGEIAYLSGIAQPDIAVVTNVYPAHLQGFGDLQAVIKEKLSISEGLLADGVLIINANLTKQLLNYQSQFTNHQLPFTNYQLPITRIVTFGEQKDCDWLLHSVVHDGFCSTFTIEGTRHSSLAQIHLPLPGQGNVENAVAAWAICRQFGLTIDDFANAIRTISPISMRAELLQIGNLTVLNDSYNANPTSMKNALDMFVSLRKTCDPDLNRRLVFICGDMAELGERAPELHAELGISIANAGIQLLLTVGKLTKITAEAAERTTQYELKILYFEDVFSVCSRLQVFIKDSDIILVKGSRTAKLEQVITKLRDIYSREGIRYPIRQLRTFKTLQRAPSTEQQEAK